MKEQTIKWAFCKASLKPLNEIAEKFYDTMSDAMMSADETDHEMVTVFSYYYDEKYDDFIIVEQHEYPPLNSEEYDRHMQRELAQWRFV